MKLKKDVNAAQEYLGAAKGMLVIPAMTRAGPVLAAERDEGALRVGGTSVASYKIEAGSLDFQSGCQKADFVFLFLTDEALKDFRLSDGFIVGMGRESPSPTRPRHALESTR
jgi:lipid-binding SYLF domain-containing protein